MARSYMLNFGDAILLDYEVPVKNTFINFDVHLPAPASSFRRSVTCPPLRRCTEREAADWYGATQELCHVMAPRRLKGVRPGCAASTAGADCSAVAAAIVAVAVAPLLGAAAAASSAPHGRRATGSSGKDDTVTDTYAIDEGMLSDVSTKESEDTTHSPAYREASDRVKPLGGQCEDSGVEVKANLVETRADGKGKGLAYFDRIKVGIEDDQDFRVVRRLIGPSGKHMQDITRRCWGSKVWICGCGSRSWEESEGPLTICVGAAWGPSFVQAVEYVQELLSKVQKEHRVFLNRKRRTT